MNNSKYRLRDSKGRFVTKIFNEAVVRALAAQKGVSNTEGEGKKERRKKIKDVIKEAKITPRETYIFYKQNEEIFFEMVKTGSTKDISLNSNQLEKALSSYKGDIFLNGKKVDSSEAKMALIKFKQVLSSAVNVVDFTMKPETTFDGRMLINIPDANKLIDDLMEYLGVKDIDELDDFTGEEITNAFSEILDSEYGEGEIVIYAS